MREIQLTKGQFAIVDDWWYDELSKHKWYTDKTTYGTFIALRTDYSNGQKRKVRMHRVIVNAQKGEDVDHINHKTLDNRECNLRTCSRTQNKQNGSPYKNCSSSLKGVTWYKRAKKYRSQIMVNGKQKHLGYFRNEEGAGLCYDKAAIKHFGDFACTNFGGI